MSIKIVAENRKARHDYEIVETFEAGMVLTGSEVKSLRNAQCQLKDSYVSFRGLEAFLQNAHISEYKASSYNNHSPERVRKLLLHESELRELEAATSARGLQIIPLKIYFKKGRAKIEIALAKGRKLHDKRRNIKEQEAKRDLKQALRHNRTS